MALRYEAWTTPWDPGGFHRKVSMMPVIDGTGRGSVGFLSLGNDGAADISLANFDRLGELVSETESSLITVYDCQPNGTNTIIDEWILDRVPQRLAETREVSLAGPSLLKEALDKALVYAFDYPMSPSVTRDWIWGKNEDSDNTGLIRNGDFEDVPLPNGGFEDGNAGHWQGTESDGDIIGNGAISAVSSPTDARTGSWYGSVNPLAQGGGARRSIGGLVPGNLYTITGWINETSGSGDRLRAGVIGASTATHTNAYEEGGVWWAEIGNASQGNGASNGSYQSITLTFRPETDQIELVIIYDDINDRTFRIDDWAISGDNVGLDPWVPFYNRNGQGAALNVARHSTAQAHNGAGSLEMQGVDGPYYDAFGRIGYGTFGVGQEVRMVPGRLYTMTAWVRHNGAGANGANERFRIVLNRKTPKGAVKQTLAGDFIPGPGSYYMASKDEIIPANTWTKIQMTVYADVSEIGAEIRYAGTNTRNTDVGTFNSPTFWVDDVSIHEGLPATTIGDIWKRLLDDCAVSHVNDTRGTVLDWIDYSSFDATNDSNGLPWNEDIPFLARWGSTMGHVLDDTFNRGYEAELVRKATPSGGKTHEFHLYNSGGRDDTPEVGINTAQPNLGGETLFRSPAYTATLVATPDGAFSEDSDAGSLANFGRLETFLMDSEASGPISRQLLSNNLLNYEQANRKAVRFELIEAPGTPRPFVDYRPGDTISMTQPPGLPKEQRRVQRIDYVNLQPTQYVVVGSRIVEGEAAAFDLIERLWRRLNRPGKTNDPELGVGGGEGVMSVIDVAASNASDLSKSRAQFVCDGVDDHVEIQAAIDLLGESGGRVLLSEGTFWVDTNQIYLFHQAGLFVGISLEGQAFGNSILRTTNPNGAIISPYNFSTIKNLRLMGNNTDAGIGGSQFDTVGIGVGGNVVKIHNVYASSLKSVVRLSGNQWTIDRITIPSGGFRLIHPGTGGFRDIAVENCYANAFVDMGNSVDVRIVNNFLAVSIIGTDARSWLIANNLWIGSAVFNEALIELGVDNTGDFAEDGCLVVGNEAQGNSFLYADGVRGLTDVGNHTYLGAHYFNNCHELIVGNNNTKYAYGIFSEDSAAFTFKGCSGGIVQGNSAFEFWAGGFRFENSDDFIVTGNIAGNEDFLTDNTWDCYHIVNSNKIQLMSNTCLPRVVNNKARYGVNVVSGQGNIVVGSNLGDPTDYGTDALNDAGTDTQLFYPNDATHGDNFTVPGGGGGGPGGSSSSKVVFSQAGTLTTGSGSFKLPFTLDAEIVSVQLAVATSPTGADLIVDVNKNGSTVFTTQANRPTVPDGDANGVGAEAVPDVTAISEGDYLTIDIDQIGSTVAGEDLTVVVEWRPT